MTFSLNFGVRCRRRIFRHRENEPKFLFDPMPPAGTRPVSPPVPGDPQPVKKWPVDATIMRERHSSIPMRGPWPVLFPRSAVALSSHPPQRAGAPELVDLWFGTISCRAGAPALSCCPCRPEHRPSAPKMVFPRHVPPAQVPVLRNSVFDWVTRSAFITPASAGPETSTTSRDDRRTGKSVGPLRSAVRPRTTTTSALGPGDKLRRARAPRLAVAEHGNGCFGDVDRGPDGYAVQPRNTAPASRRSASLNGGISWRPRTRSRNAVPSPGCRTGNRTDDSGRGLVRAL